MSEGDRYITELYQSITTLSGKRDKKLLLQTGIEPMPLTFEVSMLTCLQGKQK